MKTILKTTLFAVVVLGVIAAPAIAEDGGWSDTAEISLVSTTGNSETTSIGFKNTAERAWENASLTIRAGAINVETTTKDSFGVGTPDNFTRGEFTDTTAESYFLNGRYERNISEKFFWYGGLGWDRNEPAGIKNRYIASAGVGNVWIDTDDVKFSTGYGLTFTDQEDVVPQVGLDETFAGVRFDWDYSNQLTESTAYTNVLVLDMNLDETSDWRADMLHGLTVAMSERLALKLGLQWLYDAEPARTIPVFDAPGGTQVGFGEVDDLDQIFTASLVINF